MRARVSLLLKVCCIQNEGEAAAAVAAGATHLGLVGQMPSGPGPIDDEAIARIARTVPREVVTVLLTSRADPTAIVEHVEATGVRAVQLVRHLDANARAAVRSACPTVTLLQVVHVEGPDAVDVARSSARDADALLLDSGRPVAATPELGGTGRTHDWSVSRAIVDAVDVPVFLAGGLRPQNVAAAVAAVRPAGVDVCSGLRDNRGRLDRARLAAFVTAVR